MKLTRKCASCRQDFRKEELVEYTSISGKTTLWYCPNCLKEKQERERFSLKVCEIFGITTPGPRIWTERKRLRDNYGYTDGAIIDCLDYIYNVLKKKKLSESLVLVNPYSMNQMNKWRATKKAQANSLAVAMASMENATEYVVPVQENRKERKQTSLDDGLFDD